MPKLLTKSKFLNGLDSEALLWRIVHQPESIPVPDAFSQQIFDNGIEVGVLAQQYYDDGIDLDGLGFLENIEATKETLAERKPIFEAGFISDRYYVRVDILLPVGEGEWEIIEVKSSTKPKETHVHDLAFQRFVLERIGLRIRDTKVMLINNQYVRQGELSVRDLFYFAEVGAAVTEFLLKVPILAQRMLEIMDLPACPEFRLDDLGKGEYSNVFKDEFAAALPPSSVFELYRGRKAKIREYWDAGIQLLSDLPAELDNARHLIQRKVAISGEPHVDQHHLSAFISGLQYPIYHLDFETINPAIPPYNGIRAYMQIPFQYSLHIEHADGTVEHREYLHTDSSDPRRILFEQMHRDIGPDGTILAFYETFEKGRIMEWAQAAPEYLSWAEGLVRRMQDLLTPFKQFHYYHPNQQGSCSIKKVLPVMTDLSYTNMNIANGGEAMSAYTKYILNGQPHDDRDQLITDMLAYCKLDTWAMVMILRRLRKVVGESKPIKI